MKGNFVMVAKTHMIIFRYKTIPDLPVVKCFQLEFIMKNIIIIG